MDIEALARKLCELDGWNPDHQETIGIQHITGTGHGRLEPVEAPSQWTFYTVKAQKLAIWLNEYLIEAAASKVVGCGECGCPDLSKKASRDMSWVDKLRNEHKKGVEPL